ncbi:hypothetical protein ACIRRA_43960 [Nocardia sp. NPDC101769]|uniref:hypothetical protein n=1 Tax=Nocardia sp. NPDC101769 TaxID=3364333 RepID=UPI00380994AA
MYLQIHPQARNADSMNFGSKMHILTPNLMRKSELAVEVRYQRSLVHGGSAALRQHLGVSD